MFLIQDIDEVYSGFRALLTDSGYHLNSPLNIYITRDTIYANDGKYALDEIKLDDLLETKENDKKAKNDAYRRLYPWQIITGRLLKYTTGDESCYTPVIEKCNVNKKGQGN